MLADRSVSVLSNMLEDIKKIWFISLFIIQSVFIVFYSYSIYTNWGNLLFSITYSILFLLSLVSFIVFVIKHKNNKKTSRKFTRSKNFVKYIVNTIMLVVNIIEMIRFGINDFSKILLVFSGVLLLVQVLFEFVKLFAEKYIDDFKLAFEKDFELLDIRKWKSNALKIINAPLEKLTTKNAKDKKELSKEDKRLESHLIRHKERKEKNKEKKQKIKEEKKEEFKRREEKSVEEELVKLKNNIKSIFSKKNKDEEDDEEELTVK